MEDWKRHIPQTLFTEGAGVGEGNKKKSWMVSIIENKLILFDSVDKKWPEIQKKLGFGGGGEPPPPSKKKNYNLKY